MKAPGTASTRGTSAPILAIETSTQVARVVLIDPETRARLGAAEAVAARHSSNLLRLCAEVMGSVGVRAAGLGAIACGAGPGSFTGLRVGLAVAKGLALPTGVPLVLVSSLEALAMDMALAFAAAPDELLLPCLDAGKGEIYGALFAARGDGAVSSHGPHWASNPSDVAARLAPGTRVMWGGPGALHHRDLLSASLAAWGRQVDVVGPSADAVARRALERLARGEVDDLGAAVPAYGRAPDITRPKKPMP